MRLVVVFCMLLGWPLSAAAQERSWKEYVFPEDRFAISVTLSHEDAMNFENETIVGLMSRMVCRNPALPGREQKQCHALTPSLRGDKSAPLANARQIVYTVRQARERDNGRYERGRGIR